MAYMIEVNTDMQHSEDSLEATLQRKLHQLPRMLRENEPITIPCIPSDILESNRLYYEPRAVSIGPYYHGRERYQDAEQHKIRYLRDFLCQHEVQLEILVKEMRALEARARRCYSGFIHLHNQQFVEMLLLDGSFILEANKEGQVDIMPSATDLREAGVTFRKKQFPDNFLDITFKNGVFEMPMIGTGMEEKITILNLIAWNAKIAFEHPKQSDNSSYLYPLTSCSMLLESLLRTKNDIQLLKARGIIENNDPSDEQLANFFNHLGDLNVVSGEPVYFADLFTDIKRYYDGRWHIYQAKLKREYFHNPWSIISVVAGTILLFLTGIQAFCVIYPVACH